MKIAYIAHPIGGDVEGNLEKVAGIVRLINLVERNVVPFAPYFADCLAMFDNDKFERQRGINNNIELLKAGFIDELRLYGDKISDGMVVEIVLALQMGIKVRPMTKGTRRDYRKIGKVPL